ncbi:glycosyltransferase family 61 protein [Paenibacillus antri]|uniref:Glycosyltransferase family 61 protein n=1 Tax=Paenibacillus antri TaxID=2582848 RepID=A0A5R9GH05_9BACL|nr:glycosyltransferase family 61 protein [Paenibacillus antri]TLS52678.1 glycosyltransferase family 61 protein [Paenibacillus antri]
MRERIPDGIYESLWSWVEASRSMKLPGYELQDVIYGEDTVRLDRAIGLDAHRHPNFDVDAVTAEKAFVGVLPGGRYWVSDEGTIAVISPDNKLIWDVSMQYRLPRSRHPIFQKPDLPPAASSADTVAVLTYAFYDNYYHWLAEVLARIHLLDQSGVRVDKYIFNDFGTAGFHAETLAALGIGEDRIIRSRSGMHLKAERLIVPSLEMYSLLPYVPNFPPKWAVRYLRSKLMEPGPVDPVGSNGRERLYISREDARIRNVANEAEVVEMLGSYGFKAVTLGRMTVAEQVRAFASAETIVAPHGAGLANLVFSRPGIRLLELYSPNYVNPLYWYLSNQVGVRYFYLIGEGERLPIGSGAVDVGYRVESITVNLAALEAMLKRMCL